MNDKPFVVVDDFDTNLKGEEDEDFLGDAMPQPQGKLQVPTTSYMDV